MKFVEEHPEELSKTAKIQAQVQEVKGVMKDNIQQVILLISTGLICTFVSHELRITGVGKRREARNSHS